MDTKLAIAGGTPVRNEPFHPWPYADEEDAARVLSVVKAPVWSSGGPLEREFERAFAARHDSVDSVTVTNGTVTLLLCLRALGIKPGDEVIVPALTWIATATCAIEANAVPVFVDVNPDTFCMDPAAVEAAITPRTVAIIPVHLYSGMVDMDALTRIAEKHKLAIIEDCAHAHAAKWKGKSAGSIGDLGSFSFQSSKVMTAGEGGIVTSRNKDLLNKVYSQKNCGRNTAERGAPIFGGNHRMTEFQSAILLGQLKRLDDQVARRNANIEKLRKSIEQLPGLSVIPVQPGVTQAPQYRLSFKYDKSLAEGIPLHKFLEAVRAEGIPVEGTYPTVYNNNLYYPDNLTWFASGRGPLKAQKCPVAEDIAAASGFTLPHPILLGGDKELNDVVNAFAKVIEHAGEAADVKSRLKDHAKGLLRRIRSIG